MASQALQAISPIDGRYASKTASLIPFFSEEALIKYRVKVEIEYFIALVELPLPQLASFDTALFDDLRRLYNLKRYFSLIFSFLLGAIHLQDLHHLEYVRLQM